MAHHQPSIHLNYNLKREVSELYASVAIKNFAIGMVTLFTPIYIYIKFGNSLSSALFYFAILSACLVVFSPLGIALMRKIGIKHAILFSVPFLIAFYIVLINLDYHPLFIPLSLILFLIYNLSFWPAFHSDFVRFSSSKKRGFQVGILRSISASSVAAAPFLGGWIVVTFGFSVLFGVVSILLLLSTIPLFFSKEVHETNYFAYKNLLRHAFKKTDKKMRLALLSYGIERSINQVFWPIFIFTIGINLKSFGALTSGAIIFGLIISIIIGRITDKGGQKKLLRFGSIFVAISYIFKIFVKTDFHAFLTHSFYRGSNEIMTVPFFALFYNWVSEDRQIIDKNILFREVVHHAGKSITFAFMGVLALFITNVSLFFIIAAIVALFVYQMKSAISAGH